MARLPFSRGAFQLALEQFGKQGVVELGLLMGSYSTLALLISTFDVDLPPDRNRSYPYDAIKSSVTRDSFVSLHGVPTASYKIKR